MIERLRHYIQAAKRTPLKLLFPMIIIRVKGRIIDLYKYRKAKTGSTSITDESFLKKLDIRSSNGQIKDLIDIKFLNSFFSGEDILFLRTGGSLQDKEKILRDAEEILGHDFDLLGSGKKRLKMNMEPEAFEGNKYLYKPDNEEYNDIRELINKRIGQVLPGMDIDDYEPIDWHRDFKSGYRWDKKIWYKNIKYGHKPGIDIKVPWELSRTHHFITLGRAYFLTGNEKYTKEFIVQIVDWIENNEVQYGPNWKCTMDVAIRAANWIVSMAYFKDSSLLTDRFWLYFAKNIFLHGRHILDNLEYGSITSNHYLSDVSGLFFISMLFRDHIFGKKWLRFSISELKKEMQKQVYDDGVDFESSTCYHRLVLELFFYPAFFYIKSLDEFNLEDSEVLAKKYFGKDFVESLRRMFEVILYSVKPDGMIPQVGDNDNGRFLIFTENRITDLRYLLAYAAVFFKDGDFKIKEFGSCESVFWLFGREGVSIWEKLEGSSASGIKSASFDKGGFFIMRNDRDYIFISCTPNGQNGNGGHTHNDKLGFEMVLGGEAVFVDPGTYIYTASPEWRNRFRSTLFHNTVVIDSKEQNRFKANNLFSFENDTRIKIIKWESGKDYDFLEAEHNGYSRLEDPVIHRRSILFDKKKTLFVIRDELIGKGLHSCITSFNSAPEIEFKFDHAKDSATLWKEGKLLARIFIIKKDSTDIRSDIIKGYYSESYGKIIQNNTLSFSYIGKLPVVCTYLISKVGINLSKVNLEEYKNKFVKYENLSF
jgi:hypothetical protein